MIIKCYVLHPSFAVITEMPPRKKRLTAPRKSATHYFKYREMYKQFARQQYAQIREQKQNSKVSATSQDETCIAEQVILFFYRNMLVYLQRFPKRQRLLSEKAALNLLAATAEDKERESARRQEGTAYASLEVRKSRDLSTRDASTGIKETIDGVFTTAALPAGAAVAYYLGKFVSSVIWHDKYSRNDRTVGLADGRMIVPNPNNELHIAQHINDAGIAELYNVQLVDDLTIYPLIVTSRHIPKGQQLFLNYKAAFWKGQGKSPRQATK